MGRVGGRRWWCVKYGGQGRLWSPSPPLRGKDTHRGTSVPRGSHSGVGGDGRSGRRRKEVQATYAGPAWGEGGFLRLGRGLAWEGLKQKDDLMFLKDHGPLSRDMHTVSQPYAWVFASVDSTNLGSKIFGKKSQEVLKNKP